MNRLFARVVLVLILASAYACTQVSGDHSAPVISDISTSSKVVVISDCQNTSVTITARVTDESKIDHVQLSYRVGSSGKFISVPMKPKNDQFSAEIKGADLQGNGYGNLEFYIAAQDEAGNKSESPHDTSVQFLPCVSN
jgi:hypothetical protein